MKNTIHMFVKELKSYFFSPIAYVTLTLFLLISGFVFYLIFSDLARETAVGMGYQPVNVPQMVVRYYFGWLSTVLLFLVPLITMGVYAEEKKKGTYELLFTSPLTNLQIILGKFLANLAFGLILFAGSALVMLPLFLSESPDPVPLLVGYLGLVLFLAAVLSLGNFLSSLTENQIIAAILTFVLVLLLWFMNVFTQTGTDGVQGVLAYLSPLRHLEDFQKGVLDLAHGVYFLSVTALGIFLTYRSLESLRWRG
ncbi:MAG TPA: ABC transporter permease [Acidobacteriota bacterium]|nr:ABC transporter permease [Acidobacteriota bacterium]HQF86014.1 ABC transporter permease [Acidobacteriota bacterium]HQG90743.1 ABC transporter permease [Acidobacteriota bacterium]HQK87831.1 ABC transporter permease [Acidobacteriota bacterium]